MINQPCSTGSCKELRSIAGYCKSCWIKRTAAKKAREAEKKARGECTTCPQPVAKGKKRCYECLEKYRLQCRGREQSRIAQGLCALCGLAPLSGTSRTCSRCFCRNVSPFHFKTTKRTNELIQLLADQGGRCPYTGRDLVLGNNCSLDHKTPVSREARTTRTISNGFTVLAQ